MRSQLPRRQRYARKAPKHSFGRITRLHVENLEERRLLTIDLMGAPNWVEQGPGPTEDGQVEGLGGQDSPVAGAVESLAAHPANADILFAGTVNGGIWRTTNATDDSPNWTPLTDQFPSLSISALTFSLMDPMFNTMFAGTGDYRSGSSVVGGGAGDGTIGLLRTTDGGNTWSMLPSSATFDGLRIRSVVATALNDAVTGQQVILVATDDGGGVYRSADGGATFTQISGAAGATDGVDNDADGSTDEAGELNLPNGSASILVRDPGNNQRFYTAIPAVGVFRTDNGGVSWRQVNGTGVNVLAGLPAQRIDMTVGAAAGNPVYAAVITGGVLSGLFRSGDQGANWTQLDTPSTNEGGGNSIGIHPVPKPGAQGRIHFSIVADPNNANVVFVGGDRQPQTGPDGVEGNGDDAWPNSVGANNFSGRLFRVDGAQAAGSQATPVTNDGANDTSPHADSRDMVIDANGDFIESDDGGIYRLVDPANAAREWEAVVGNLRVTEFYGVAYDSLNNVIIGGAQDVGAPEQQSPGGFTWEEDQQGDGFIAESGLLPGNFNLRYLTSQNMSTFNRKLYDNTNALVTSDDIDLLVNGTGGGTATLSTIDTLGFYQPYAINVLSPVQMIIGTTFLYESTDGGDTLTALGGQTGIDSVDNDGDGTTDEADEVTLQNPVGQVQAIGYGGSQGGVGLPGVLYVGTAGGTVNGVNGTLFLRTTNSTNSLADFTTLATYPGASPRDITLDPADFARAYILDTNGAVWRTTDAGATAGGWTNLTGNLAGNPFVSELRTTQVVPGPGGESDVLLVGGLGGVARTLLDSPNAGVWTEVGLNLPNMRAFDLRYDAADDLLLAGTIGRGAWTVANASVELQTPGVLTVCGDEDFVNQDDEFILIRDAGNPTLLNVFVNGVLEFTGALAALEQINVFGVGGNDTLIVDSSNGLIAIPNGIRYDGDGACPEHFDEGGQGGAGYGYDRGIDTLQLLQTGGDVQTSDAYSVGPDIGSGISTIVGPGGTQKIFFEELEPVIDLVPAASLSVTATPEHNSITYSDAAVATNGLITIDNYESMEFSNKTNVVINAGSGDDVVSADNALTPTGMTTLTINGDDGRDNITLAQLLTLTTVNGGAGDDVVDGSLVTAAVLTLNGDDGSDWLTGGSLGDALGGGNGDDTLLAGPGDNNYTGGAGFDTVIVRGTPAADLISLSQTAAATLVSTINGNIRNDIITAIEAVTLEALAGADTMVVLQIDALVLAPAGSVPITVLGGPPGAGDTLRVFDDGLGDTDIQRIGPDGASGFFTIGPLAPISYEGVEFAALIPQNSITGGTGADGLGRLLVFKVDPYEQNNSLPSATHIGAGATLNVDPTIDPGGFDLGPLQIPGDEDWYRFVAAETGVLDFQMFFREVPTLLNGRAGLPGNGALTLRVYDSDGLPPAGNPLGTGTPLVDPAGNTIGRHVAVPVVRNQVYNMRVFGTTASSINVYNFSVINVPTPVPQQVDLTAATDSGRNDSDNITNFDAVGGDAAVFDIVLDDDRLDEFSNLNLLPDTVNDDLATVGFDYGVQVFNNGVSIGFAFLNVGNTWRFTATTGDLVEGHNNFISAAVWVRDRATPAVLGRGDLSQPLQVTLDTIAPANPTILIDPATSDTGVAAFPATIADRVTSDAATGFLGRAEADTIVRLWADGDPVSLGLINASDVFQGLTVAEPLDGDEAFPNGQWDLTPRFDLNDPSVGFPLDGFRQITATAEDVAGNESSRATPAVLNIFIDTQGPQVTSVHITDEPAFDLFDPKPTQGPTPLVFQLSIDIRDLPNRNNIDPNFLYDALAHNPGHDNDPAEDPGNYLLRGDHNGVIPIQTVQFIPDAPQNGLPATGTIVLTFFEPLPDDRFTLTLKDSLVDPAGNKLDGESNAAQPLEDPFFPSGDGQPGGDFLARFTVDSRPEIGVWAAGSVYIDTNGNFTFDPQNLDFVNRDITYVLGFTSDDVFAGNFALNPGDVADGFDKLAAYGRVAGQFRWLVDTDNDGVPNVNQVDPANINGVPVAGEFDGNTANGDEVGLFTGTTWWFDTNHDFKVDYALNSALRGYPIVGDFDGDGFDDLATWTDDRFQFDLAGGVLRGWNGTVDATINFGFIGVRERPVAADMDQDGIDDIGLFVPDRGGTTPRETAEWYFLLSNDFDREIPDGEEAAAAFAAIAGTVNTLDHPFTPIPFGKDIFAQFGDDFAVPVIGNFDPPFPGGTSIEITVGFTNSRESLDVNDDGYITPLDALLIINQLNSVGSHQLGLQLASVAAAPYIDTNGDGYVSPVDALLVINRLNANAAAGSSSSSDSSLRVASAMVEDSTPAAVTAIGASSVTTADLSSSRVSTDHAPSASPSLLFSTSASVPVPHAHGQFGRQFEGLADRRTVKTDEALPDTSPAVRRMHALIDGGLARLGSGRSRSPRLEASARWDNADGEALVSSIARDVAKSARRQSAKDAVFADLV